MSPPTIEAKRRLRAIPILAPALLVAAALLAAGVVAAEGGLCSFTLSGTVTWVWYPGPWPPPAAVMRVEVPVGDETDEVRSYLVYCWDELAPQCAALQPGTPVLVLGDDDGTQRHVTHVGVRLEPVEGR